ncbi:MAG: M23 family metallopeptidase [Candidatus Hydromicrobium sp.]|nr:M23 family metallopeptidase [Candidatus Hydromicrobium sp.]
MTQASTGPNHHKSNNVKSNNNKSDILKFILFLSLFLCVLTSLPSPVYSNYRSPFIIPINGEVITRFRQSYLDTDKQRFLKHTGIDIKGKYGQKVAAAGNGIVSYSGFSPTGGRTLVIKHNQKIRTTYLNLMQIYVSTGTYVKQGEIIAAIGADDDPSNSQCHLHFGVIYDKKYLDPEDLLKINYSSISKFLYLKYLPSDFKLDYGNNTHK